MSGSRDPEILNIEEAARLLGVSVKTFNKVLHTQNLPARKIGREWKFSRQHLIDWVGSGRSADFYREAGSTADGAGTGAAASDAAASKDGTVLKPAQRRGETDGARAKDAANER